MAKFALDTLKAKTAVIYLDNSTDYSKSLAQVFEKVFTAGGGKVLMTEAFLGKDQDFQGDADASARGECGRDLRPRLL